MPDSAVLSWVETAPEKTTLFELVSGRLPADVGDVSRPADWRIAYMRQEAASSARTALDFVLDGHHALRLIERQIGALEARTRDAALDTKLAELYVKLDDVGGYQAESVAAEILDGLGFTADQFTQPHSSFSGGWRIRLQLAQTLMAPSELLLLDEPTNHLDLEAIVWLESWLKRYPGTLVFISHDKRFIDQIADHVLHLEGRRIASYRGNYTDFERERALDQTRRASARVKQQKRIDEINEFARRFRAKATKAKQVQSRLKMLDKMTEIAPVIVETQYDFRFEDPDKLPQPLVNGRDLALGYADRTVLTDVGFSLLPGDRIGVLGINGAGKSTLLKSVVGDLPALAGDLHRGAKVQTGYFAQQQLDHLSLEEPILALLLRKHPNLDTQSAKNYLGGWGFAGDDLERHVRTLSGGEKARLVLALLAKEKPAILVLDEPTNHLDLAMRESLALALQSYQGAVLLVSHDRELLDQCVDELWLVEDGHLQIFDGDLDDYIAQDSERRRRAKETPASKRDARRQSAEARQQLQPLKQEARSLEAEHETLGEALAKLDAEIADQPIDIEAILKKRAELARKLDEVELRWIALLEQIDARES